MSSAAQVAANQSNARHSTGPRTPEGKGRVAQNALRHGLTARHIVIREDEREEFAALHASLSEELDPQGAMEIIAFQELLHAAWNLNRFRRVEVEISTGTIQDFTRPKYMVVLERLARYQARGQRAWQKATQELRTLQTNRALRARNLSEQEAAEVPALASIKELTKKEVTKQTHRDLTKQTHQQVPAESIPLPAQAVNREAFQEHEPAQQFVCSTNSAFNAPSGDSSCLNIR